MTRTDEETLVLRYMDDLEGWAEEEGMSLECASDLWPFEDWLFEQREETCQR